MTGKIFYQDPDLRLHAVAEYYDNFIPEKIDARSFIFKTQVSKNKITEIYFDSLFKGIKWLWKFCDHLRDVNNIPEKKSELLTCKIYLTLTFILSNFMKSQRTDPLDYYFNKKPIINGFIRIKGTELYFVNLNRDFVKWNELNTINGVFYKDIIV